MDFPVGDKGVFGFGPFLLDSVRRRLTLDGEIVKLTPRPVELLLYFAENPGRVLDKDELMAALWGGRVVEEGNLSQTVFLLRRALRRGGLEEAIVTAPGRGYRFTAEVRMVSGSAAPMVPLTMGADSRPVGPRLAKLSPPRLPRTIPRPSLFDRLRAGCKHRVLWLAGPPGAGKSTLISSYLNWVGVHARWYSVDAGDSDPANFFFYLEQALDATFSGQMPLPHLTPEYLQDLPGFTRRFFRAAAERMPSPFSLVLDNFQDASGAASLNQIVRDAAGELGSGVSLIVISREEPAPVFARLRANQEMVVFGWDDLRLTAAETAEIVAQHDPDLLPEAPEIHARTGGWAAGLTLMLQGGIRQGSTQNDLRIRADLREPPQAIFDYLASEIFETAAEDTRRILLTTAYLPRVTEATARFLSERSDAGLHLRALARRRLFTDMHVAEDTYFQYHALLREFLCGQLDRLYGQEQRTQLLQRSARAAEQTGDPEGALALYEKAQDFEAASTILASQAPLLFAQGRWHTLRSYLLRQPAAQLARVPWLIYWLGVSTCWTDQVAGRDILKDAQEAFVRNGDAVGQIMAVCGIVDSHLMDWLDMSGVGYWIEVLRAMVLTDPQLPAGALELRLYSVLLAALAAFRPHDEIVATCQARVGELCRDGARRGIAAGPRLMGAADLVQSLAWGGSSGPANAAASEFEMLAAHPDVTPLQRCKWLTCRSYVHLITGDVAAYRQSWQKAEDVASQAGLGYMVAISRFQIVQALLLDGRLSEADSRLRQIISRPDDKPVHTVLFYFTHAWLALLQGRFDAALDFAEKVCGVPCAVVRSAQGTVTRCIYAQALAACGQHDRALAKAREASCWFAAPGQSVLHYVALLTEADILHAMGRREEALPILEAAFATGRRGSHFLVTPWLPDMMTRLARLALAAGIETDYVRALVRARGLAVACETATACLPEPRRGHDPE